jgi:hypothetical protein
VRTFWNGQGAEAGGVEARPTDDAPNETAIAERLKLHNVKSTSQRIDMPFSERDTSQGSG